jgi:antitoxin component of MazEF toxin-antitoxin module
MSTSPVLERQRQSLLEQIAALPAMRRGTLLSSPATRKRKDGTLSQRGPYWRYTRKEKGKTVGCHIGDEVQADLYRQQIAVFRRFEVLCAQLVEVCEEMADRDVKKKTKTRRTKN